MELEAREEAGAGAEEAAAATAANAW